MRIKIMRMFFRSGAQCGEAATSVPQNHLQAQNQIRWVIIHPNVSVEEPDVSTLKQSIARNRREKGQVALEFED